jgi:hypothetical protein
MGKVILRPSKKFMALIVLHGNLNAAIRKWGVPYNTIGDWIEGRASLPGDTIARLVEVTGRSYDELFEHRVARKRPPVTTITTGKPT